jgi:SIR2-like domain
MDLPTYLIDRVREGHVVLFLGAGASHGAVGAATEIPDAKRLASLLSDHFLGGQDKGKPLSIVAEYCIAESDVQTFQQYVRDLFVKFSPSSTQLQIPTYRWAAIVTTNFDLVVERAYAAVAGHVQDIVPIIKNSDRVDAKLRTDRSVPFLKLHGCINHWNDLSTPLILTIDQYITHKKNRDKLFERFKHYASEYTVVFVGYRLEDPDLRQILLELADPEASRPRCYVVSPSASDRDEKVWESKRITTLKGTFEEFLLALSAAIPEALRAAGPQAISHPIERLFVRPNATLTPETHAFLEADALYLRPDHPVTKGDPKTFYKGASYDWAPLAFEWDSKRHITDSVLSDAILVDDVDRPSMTDFYLLSGHAGSGKSVALKRLAWDACSFGKLCLFVANQSRLTVEPLIELCELTGERLFVFVDRVSNRVPELQTLLQAARSRSLRITLIACERTNEWNTECTDLGSFVSETYSVQQLSQQEIEWLIDKLAAHQSLGAITGLRRSEQVNAFARVANRQLLVALYEATSGKPFEEIVFDEYNSVVPVDAQSLYLTVCALNRIGVPVRAGIVKRVNGISFDQFKERFFGPLEGIVLTEDYRPGRDMAYRTRHPWIAETVFERALPSQNDRLDLYLKLFDALDIGYGPDRIAYRGLTRARDLQRVFSDPLLVRRLFDAASSSVGADDAYLHQQRAIYEMKRPNGNLDHAYEELQFAKRLAPYDKSILHSLAELEFSRSQHARTGVEKARHLQAAQDIASALTGKNADTSHGYHTLIRIGLQELAHHLKAEAPNDEEITRRLRLVQQTLDAGRERFPDDVSPQRRS